MNSQEFKFEEESHTYTLGGKPIVSATGLMKENGLYGQLDFVTDEHLWRGKMIHEMMEMHHQGILDVAKLEDEIRGYHRAWLKFVGETGFRPLGFEKKMFHPVLKFGATPDVWGLVATELWILDYKHGIVQNSTAIQLALYQLALINSGEIEPTGRPIKRVGIQLKADGNYTLKPFLDDNDLNIATMMISVHNWRINNVK